MLGTARKGSLDEADASVDGDAGRYRELFGFHSLPAARTAFLHFLDPPFRGNTDGDEHVVAIEEIP